MNRGGLVNGNVIDLAVCEVTDQVTVNKSTGEILVMDVKLAEVETTGLWTILEATEPEQLERLAAHLTIVADKFRALRSSVKRVPA